MDLYILNTNYERIAVIDQADSILWDKKYNDTGYCEIYIACTEENLCILQKGYYVYRTDDDMFCQITKIELETSVENGDHIIATATDMCNVFSGRIVWDQIVFNGTVGNFIKKVLDDNVISTNQSISSNQSSRNIANLIFDDSNLADFDAEITQTIVSEDILNLIITTCKTYSIGFRVSYNIDTNKLVFRLYFGENKATVESDEYVEFSPTFSNIISSKYIEDDTLFKNYAVVGAKDSDDSLMYISVYLGDSEPTGESRKEIYVDATGTNRDITVDELMAMFPSATLSGTTYYITVSGVQIAVASVNGDKVTVTDYTYELMLEIIGKNSLVDHNTKLSFTGEVDTIDTYEYKTDYDIGDIVIAKNEYGIGAAARIIEIMESEDNEEGYVVEPKFDYGT